MKRITTNSLKELKDLDKDMKHAVKVMKIKLFIFHDSIGYLERYHFEQEGIENMNAEEPSQKI